LQVIDVSDPANPRRVGGYYTSGYAEGVAVSGNYAYVADFDAGLQVIDVSDPANPRRVGGYDTIGYAQGVAISGNYAYLAVPDAGLQVIDVSDPANPRWVGGYDTSGFARGVAVSGHYAYVADEKAGLQVIDVSDPANPRRVGGYDRSGSAYSVAVSGNYAYVADGGAGLQVIDVSNPANPRRVGGYDTPGRADGVAVSGNYAYVADYDWGLQILRIGDGAPSAEQFDYPLRLSDYGWTLSASFGADVRGPDGTVYQGHLGEDLAAPTGTPVRATAAGTVVLAQPDAYPGQKKGWGNVVLVEHRLPGGQKVWSLYGHLSRILVSQGQEVSLGQAIGEVGATGFASGPHLHFEIKEASGTGPGYAAVSFTGHSTTVAGVRYYRPSWFIEQRRTVPVDRLATVFGTGGLGLNLRGTASLSAQRLALLPEGTAVTVLDGLEYADGYVWRQVRVGEQTGWVASMYLALSGNTGGPAVPAPVALQQLAGDAVTVIPPGGEVVGDAVWLAATAPAGSGVRVKLQVEVRPADGTAFRGFTHESGFVAGGAVARVRAGSLSARGYRWRARWLSEEGRASAWTVYGSDQATVADFTVRAELAPLALFGQEPQVVVAGEPVQFAAQAEAVAGRTFAWSFSDGTEAAGRAVSHVFAQPGAYTVVLTVRDANGLSSQRSATVSVASAELRDQVQRLADTAVANLNEILARAGELELAADYFAEGVDSAGTPLVVSGVLSFFDEALGFAQWKEWVKLSFNQEVIGTSVQEALPTLVDQLLAQMDQSDPHRFSGLFMPAIGGYIRAKRDELQQLREAVLAELPALSAEQAQALARQLAKRVAGNVGLTTYYGQRAHLPLTYADLKQADETSWSMAVAEPVFNFGVGLLLVVGAEGLSGLSAFVLPLGADFADFIWEQNDILAGQSLDAQMLILTTAVLGDATSVARLITDNAKAGLVQAREGRLIAEPAGQMEPRAVTVGGLRVFGLSTRWFAREAHVEITVRNTGTRKAEFWVTGAYPQRFTTTELRRLGVTFASRSYDITVPLGPLKFSLDPGETGSKSWVLMDEHGGSIPKEPIHINLLAKTDDGFSLLAAQDIHFGTTFIDEAGNPLPPDQTEGLVLTPQPVRTWAVPGPQPGQELLAVQVFNPLEAPLLTEVRQPLPAGREVLDAGEASLGQAELVWEVALEPGQSLLLTALLRAPGADNGRELPATLLSAHDAINERWENFQATPMVLGTLEWPAPIWEGPLRLTAEGFEAWLNAPAAGTYRVEASGDLRSWETLVTLTNVSGRVRVVDPAALGVPHRFYRVKVETGYAVDPLLDTDRDGMPDAYENQYSFLDPNNPNDASLDYDGDGMSNLAEYRAGTAPDDPLWYLRITAVTVRGTNGVEIAWGSAANKLYTVQRAGGLWPGAFTNLAQRLLSTPPQNVYLDTTATNAAHLFYRIKVE
jgi:murein DD-endopeptidase MepM/ murein hydrolase activator NlpD/PKD repeat protein